jgi:hypothetical protein
MIVGLLLIALVCLVLGLALPSSAWLIASLIATAGAGFLLIKARSTILAVPRATPDGSPVASDADSSSPGGKRHTGGSESPTAVLDRVPALPAPGSADVDDVWVIDGRPRYHLKDCAIIASQDAEPIPFDQATEDGFMPCSLCQPNLALNKHTTQH